MNFAKEEEKLRAREKGGSHHPIEEKKEKECDLLRKKYGLERSSGTASVGIEAETGSTGLGGYQGKKKCSKEYDLPLGEGGDWRGKGGNRAGKGL